MLWAAIRRRRALNRGGQRRQNTAHGGGDRGYFYGPSAIPSVWCGLIHAGLRSTPVKPRVTCPPPPTFGKRKRALH